MKSVIYIDTLVSAMGSIVDRAVQDAIHKGVLPKDAEALDTIDSMERNDYTEDWKVHHKLGVAELYSNHAARYCHPIASTLAIHPSSQEWHSALIWSVDHRARGAWWSFADCMLRISMNVNEDGHLIQQLLQNEDSDVGIKFIIKELASHRTPLAIWEVKSVETAQVMEKIAEMGIHAKFQWKKCTSPDCTHHSWEVMQEPRKGYDPGFDPRSPPWTLPIVPSASSAANLNLRTTPLREGLRSASARGGTTSGSSLSYKEPSSSSVEGGKVVGKKRYRNDSDASEYKQPPMKKSKTDSMDEFYDPLPGAQQEVNAQLVLQQVA
jgi:hypothetical protein